MKHTVILHSFCIDPNEVAEATRSGLMPHGTFEFESDNEGEALYEEVFRLQNAEGNPSGEKVLPNVCSMTAGDLMKIDDKWVLCASVGWAEISEDQAAEWMTMTSMQRSSLARSINNN
jgi:hypothetical protein